MLPRVVLRPSSIQPGFPEIDLMSDSMVRAALPCLALLASFRAAPVQAREVSWSELLAFAQEHAPQLRVARESARLADGERAAAGAWFPENPELTLSIGPRFGVWGDGLDFSAGLHQPIELSGGRSARLQAAANHHALLAVEREQTELELRLELERAYRDAQLSRQRALLSADLAAFAAELRASVERRLAAGDATLIELRVAEGEAARAASEERAARQSLRIASLTLCELSGWPSGDPPLPAAELPTPRALPGEPELRALAERAHPELRLARARLELARAETEVAERAVSLQPVLGAEVSRESGPTEAPDWIVLGTLRVSLPLWQRHEAERARGRGEQRLAQANAEAVLHIAGLRISRALAELEGAADRLQLLAASGASFQDSLSLLRRGLEAGELGLLEVSVARQRLLDSQLAVLDARADYEHAFIELQRAVGQSLAGEP
jgi:cobalt-zinc-cadmium efflux system outer membrane protein